MNAPRDNFPTAASVLADIITLLLVTFAAGTVFGVVIDRVLR